MHVNENDRIWHLLARKMAKEISDEEDAELNVLLHSHPSVSHVNELLKNPWQDVHKLKGEKDSETLSEEFKQRLLAIEKDEEVSTLIDNETNNGNDKPVKYLWKYAAFAASILLMLFVSLKYWYWPLQQNENLLTEQLVTKKGTRSEILLPDGTKVWLNAGSNLDYPKSFKGKTRAVKLSGEAFFKVAKNEKIPFLVHTETFTIKVLGTTFNVRAYSDEDSAVTSLLEGKVEVRLNNDKNNPITLKPNDKLTVASSVEKPEEPQNDKQQKLAAHLKTFVEKATITPMLDSTIAETAWVRNKLVFKNSSFEKITSTLEKWYGVEIRFKTENKKNKLILLVVSKTNRLMKCCMLFN